MSSTKRSSPFQESESKRCDHYTKYVEQIFDGRSPNPIPPDFVLPLHLEIYSAIGLIKVPIDLKTTVGDVIKHLVDAAGKAHEDSAFFIGSKNGHESNTIILSPSYVPLRGFVRIAHILFTNPQWIGHPFHRALSLDDNAWTYTRPPVVFKLDFVDEFSPYVPRPIGYIPNLVIAAAHDDDISLPTFFCRCWAHRFGMFDKSQPAFSFEITNGLTGQQMNGGDATEAIGCGKRREFKSPNDIVHADTANWINGHGLFNDDREQYFREQYFRVEIVLHKAPIN